ncbi:21860_t:CDS:2, partial [Rhizophagus irregularis]
MPLRRSSKSKNRSLNLRQRKEQVRNNVTNIDNTINDVATELKDNNDDANESGFEHYTEYNETDYVDSENENNYVDSDDENNYVDSDNESDDSDDENNYIESDDDESDDENDYVDSDDENNDVVSDNEVEHKNFEGSENILENNTLPNSPFDGEFGPYFSLIKKYTIPISNMKTQSTSQPFREAYAISLFDIIKKTLSNPLLISKMYNGPGIEVENKSEFWHGELWQQSPLFGEHNITINSGDFVHIMASNQLNCIRITSIILHNSRLKLKLQRFLTFDELPAQYQTADRYSNSSNKRWLLEDKPIIVEPEVIVGKTSVWLQDQEEPNYYTYIVAEILYNYQNKWKIRNICYRFRHPSEYCPFPQNPHNLPIIIDKLIQCWVVVAKCAKLYFSLFFNNESYKILNDLLNQEAILLTKVLRNIIDSTLDSHYNNFLGNGYFQDNIFRLLLSSWFATSATISNTEKIAINEAVESPDNSIYEIQLQAKWKQYKILQNNFETNISINGDIYYGLKTAYKEYFNFTEYLHNTKIIYFNYISYKVLNQDGESSIIRISVGNVVELEEKLEGNSYAIVQAIFLHTYNNAKTYPFYFLKWFEKIEGRNGIDSLMMCQKYKICTERKKWHNVFPISFVTSIPKVHFVHQCVNDCS